MQQAVLGNDFGHIHGVVAKAVENKPWEAELVGGVEGPPEEGVGDHEADTWKRLEGSLEVGLHVASGEGEGEEEVDGREIIGALDAGGDFGGDALREREGDHGG